MLSSSVTSEALGCLNISYQTAYANVNQRSNTSVDYQESNWKSSSPELLEPQQKKHGKQLCASWHKQLQLHASQQTACTRSCPPECLKHQHLTRRQGNVAVSLQHYSHINRNVCNETEQRQSWYEYESIACLQAEVYLAAETVSEVYMLEENALSLPDLKYNSGLVVSQQLGFLHDPALQIISNQKAVNKPQFPTVQQPLKPVSHSPANVVLDHNMPAEKSHPLSDVEYSGPLVSQLPDSSLLHNPALQALSDQKSANEPLFPTAQQPLEPVIYSPTEGVSDHHIPEEQAQAIADVEYSSGPVVSQQKGVLHDPALQVNPSKMAKNKQLFPTTQLPLEPLLNEEAAKDSTANKRNQYAAPFNRFSKSTIEVRANMPEEASVPLQSGQTVINTAMVAKDQLVCKSLTEVSHKTVESQISDASKNAANLMQKNDDIMSFDQLLTELEFENWDPSLQPEEAEKLSQVPDLKSKFNEETKQSSKTIQPALNQGKNMSITAFDRSLRSSRMIDSLRLSASLRESLLRDSLQIQCSYASTPTLSWGMQSSEMVEPTRLTQSTETSVQRGLSNQVDHRPLETVDREMQNSKMQDSVQERDLSPTESETDSILSESSFSDYLSGMMIQMPQRRRVACREFGFCIKAARYRELFITLITPEVEEMFGFYSSIVELIAKKSSCQVRLLRAVLNRRSSSSGGWARFAQVQIGSSGLKSIMTCDRMLREKFRCYQDRRRVRCTNRKPMASVTFVRSRLDTSKLAFGKQRYKSWSASAQIHWNCWTLQRLEPEDLEMELMPQSLDVLGDSEYTSGFG